MMKLVTFITIISFLFCLAFSQSTVKTLPGYSGNLPFKLETGYVSVGENNEFELFYYFIESERNPNEDPLLLWLTGGPGCSGLNGLAFEIGPIAFDASSFNGSLPSLIRREHSWTKIANVIFIDSPVGTGFSYATQPSFYNTSDTLSAKHTDTFFRKWLLNHPKFIRNDMYIGGDSYGGKMTPIVVHELIKGNEAGLQPQILLQGYLIGNPVTDFEIDNNEKIPYAHGMALIPTEYYELAKRSCQGKYVTPDPNNVECLHILGLIDDCFNDLNMFHILEKVCPYDRKKKVVTLLEDDWHQIHMISPQQEKPFCRDEMNDMVSYVWGNDPHVRNTLHILERVCPYGRKKKGVTFHMISSQQENKFCRDEMNGMVSYIWGNDPQVRNALHVRNGTIKEWRKCNTHLTSAHKQNVASAIPYHQFLRQKISKALVYSGDHDMMIPYSATLKWIGLLNLTIDEAWRAWNVNDDVAGYTQKYKKNGFSLTFATVKGAGHTVPEFKPEQSLAMVDRWISSNPL